MTGYTQEMGVCIIVDIQPLLCCVAAWTGYHVYVRRIVVIIIIMGSGTSSNSNIWLVDYCCFCYYGWFWSGDPLANMSLWLHSSIVMYRVLCSLLMSIHGGWMCSFGSNRPRMTIIKYSCQCSSLATDSGGRGAQRGFWSSRIYSFVRHGVANQQKPKVNGAVGYYYCVSPTISINQNLILIIPRKGT